MLFECLSERKIKLNTLWHYYSLYNGFIKGLYRTSTDPISEECFGEWIVQNFTRMGDILDKYFTYGKDIPIEEAKEVAVDLVSIVYVNNRQC